MSYATREAAEAAISTVNGSEVDGRKVTVLHFVKSSEFNKVKKTAGDAPRKAGTVNFQI